MQLKRVNAGIRYISPNQRPFVRNLRTLQRLAPRCKLIEVSQWVSPHQLGWDRRARWLVRFAELPMAA